MKKSFLITTFLSFIMLGFSQTERPQEPQPPFDYLVEDVVFENKTDSVKLAGTLTIPKNAEDFATVVLISGSGAQDRNSEILGHKPFLVIADHLTNNGIAVLRVDDRGTSESEGDYNKTKLDGFVRDTESALAYLNTRSEINPNKIGLIGHSLGGIIAPIVASSSKDVAFIVLLAGPGIRGDKLMLLQKEMVERQMGASEILIENGQKTFKGAYDIILDQNIQKDSLVPNLNSYFKTAFGGMLPEDQLNALSSQLAFPWLVDFIRFDPSISLSKTSCPVLALNGSNDLQVPAEKNLNTIDSILKANGNKNVIVRNLEGLNHLFQESDTGMPQEYALIEQTFSTLVLEIMSEWIKDNTY